MSDIAVEAAEVTKSFGDHQVLRGLSLAVPRGTVYSLLGPNGAGKTTTVRILATLARPDSGRVRVAGFDALGQRREVRSRISLTGQHAAVDAAQTGAENLRMAGRLAGLTRLQARQRAGELLAQFGLADAGDRRASTYSGGMRRRLDLAAGLVSRPEVMFLDEPTTGLDPQSRRQLWEIIGEFQRRGGTVLLTTHYMDEAERLCDRLAIIDHGQVIAAGTPPELIDRLGGQHVVEFSVTGNSSDGSPKTPQETWHGLPGVESVHADDGLISLTVRQPHVTIPALLDAVSQQGAELRHLTTRQASLEDVFVRLTGRHLREE